MRIVFHQVIAVYVDGNGTRFFETKGTSNETRDLYPAREDFLVGKYVETPVGVRNAFKWVCSPIGTDTLSCCLPMKDF